MRSTRRAALRRRLARLDWDDIETQLDARGFARTARLLDARQCQRLGALFERDAHFRASVEMAKQSYGQGRYRYFATPLPPLVMELRTRLYPPLAEIANRWQQRLGETRRFEARHDSFLARCHRAGQTRPTPLLLRYGPGGHNRLHQDRYGPLYFPLQVTLLLSAPGRDFEGGAFLLNEQRARQQTRGFAIELERGQAVIFPNSLRPVESARGFARATLRHGVSDVTRGERTALGIIFHDAL